LYEGNYNYTFIRVVYKNKLFKATGIHETPRELAVRNLLAASVLVFPELPKFQNERTCRKLSSWDDTLRIFTPSLYC